MRLISACTRALGLLSVCGVLYVAAFAQEEVQPAATEQTAASTEEVTPATDAATEAEADPYQWFYFLGRFHPIILHFPIGLIVILLMVEVVGVIRGSTGEMAAARWVLLTFGALSAVVAAFFGWFLSWVGGYDADIVWSHQLSGFFVAGLASAALIARFLYDRRNDDRFGWAYGISLVACAGVLVPASHYGAELTHGTTYLTRYLPEQLAFLGPVLGKVETPEEGGASAGYFNKQILPIIEAKCFECHGPEKREGEYRMDSPEEIVAAGESERPGVVPGDAMASYAIALILLPPEHKDVMPPLGKEALTGEEKYLLAEWVNRGAPFGEYTPPPPAPKEEKEKVVVPADLALGEGGLETSLMTCDESMTVLFEPMFIALKESLKVEPAGRAQIKAAYNAAFSLAEVHNLLFSRDDEDYMKTPEWAALSIEARHEAEAVGVAVTSRDYAKMKEAVGVLANTCNKCHTQYETESDEYTGIDEVAPVEPADAAAAEPAPASPTPEVTPTETPPSEPAAPSPTPGAPPPNP